MRRLSLLLAQFGSFVMILVSVYFALVPLFNGEFLSTLIIGVGGVLYWTAMFYVFGAVDDYLKEKAQRPVDLSAGVSASATDPPPIPWEPKLGRPDPADVQPEEKALLDEEKYGPPQEGERSRTDGKNERFNSSHDRE
jgi:hypothetical protein